MIVIIGTFFSLLIVAVFSEKLLVPPHSFFLHPQMAEDLIETFSAFSHALVSFSIGEYSNHDSCDVWGGSMLMEGMVIEGIAPLPQPLTNSKLHCVYIKTVLSGLVLQPSSPNIP